MLEQQKILRNLCALILYLSIVYICTMLDLENLIVNISVFNIYSSILFKNVTYFSNISITIKLKLIKHLFLGNFWKKMFIMTLILIHFLKKI